MKLKRSANLVPLILIGACGLPAEHPVQVTTNLVLPAEEQDPRVAEWVSDGTVTVPEMDEAYQAYFECMGAAGMEGKYSYSVETLALGMTMEINMPGDGAEGRLTDAVERRCRAQTITPVEGLFDDPVPIGEQMARSRQRTIDCLAEEDPSYATIPSDVSVERGSALQLRVLNAGGDDSPLNVCIMTAGVGWTDIRDSDQR